MIKDIVIIGAGGLGKEVAWLIENINSHEYTWNLLGFLEDEKYNKNWGKTINGYPVLGGNSWIQEYEKEIFIICAIGKGSVRKFIYDKVLDYTNAQMATLIDPSVRIDKTVQIGEGSIICKNTSITVNTTIGKGVLLNINSLIGHDTEIGDYCTFSPHAMTAGHTNVGDFCEIGAGAFILQGKTIANNTVIAPLSAIYKDILEPGMYSGNPARQMR